MTPTQVNKKIAQMEAHADAIKSIAAGLKSETPERLHAPATRKGLTQKKKAAIVAKRRAALKRVA